MLEDQPTNPEYLGNGCPMCGNHNEDGDIYLHDVEYDGDETGVYIGFIWICERCQHTWEE